jgi:hypothetical protein
MPTKQLIFIICSRKYKLANGLDFLLNSTTTNCPGFFHCEIYCPICENKIIKNIVPNIFSEIDEYAFIHNIQFGRCVLLL